MADQLNPLATPAYGNPLVHAPNLAGLGRDGVVFDRAYCNSPICAPSRASMLTGRLPSGIGVYDNGAELAASIPTIAHLLRAEGYRTCLAGKMHFIGPDQLHGFEARLTTDVYPAGLDWTPDWERPPGDRLPWYHDMSSVLEAGPCEATLQTDYDEEVAFRSVRALHDLARDEGDAPFFMVASFIHPHDPWEVPAAFFRPYDGIDVGLPAVPAMPEDRQDPHSLRILDMCGASGLRVPDDVVRSARRAYLAAVSYLDERVGELLAALDRSGLRRDTVVVVTADHGEMLGERGLWYKMSFFEGSARVPLIVTAPDRFAPRRVGRGVSLVDLVPTLAELAGVAAPDRAEGTSLVPLLRGDAGAGPDAVVGEYLGEGTVRPMVMVLRGRHKFVRCPGDPDQLYDLEEDPLELTNAADDPGRSELVRAFRDEVAARWDLERLEAEVLESQRRRRLVLAALEEGRPSPWDYRPPEESPERYVRGTDFWRPFAGARLPSREDDPPRPEP
jgi:choline-sulfatase